MNNPFLVLQYPDLKKGRSVAIAATKTGSILRAFKEAILREARLEVLNWDADETIRIRNQSELTRLESVLARVIPDCPDGLSVD